jgi:hypothetical protein
MQTVLSSGNKAPGYAAGEGDLADLTRAGAGILAPQAAQAGMNPIARQLLVHALASGAGGVFGGKVARKVRLPVLQLALVFQSWPALRFIYRRCRPT